MIEAPDHTTPSTNSLALTFTPAAPARRVVTPGDSHPVVPKRLASLEVINPITLRAGRPQRTEGKETPPSRHNGEVLPGV